MKGKEFEVKSNHHYVWADYLRRWSKDERNIWYTTPTGKVCCDSIRGLAKDKFFYKTQSLEPKHLDIIRKFSSLSPEYLQEQHFIYLEDFLRIQCLEEIPAKRNKESEKNKHIHMLRCNVLENLHACHERDAQPIMSSLAKRDLSVLENNENMLKLLIYLGHQFSRTKSFKETALSALDIKIKSDGGHSEYAQTIRECWWFLSYMFGMNIGASLYQTSAEDKHCLLIYEGDEGFITSDQPIVNVHPNLVENNFAPPDIDTFDLFYPISPKVAFMINKSSTFPCGISTIHESVTLEMNEKIAKRAESYIFGTTKRQVKKYKNFVGERIGFIRKQNN